MAYAAKPINVSEGSIVVVKGQTETRTVRLVAYCPDDKQWSAWLDEDKVSVPFEKLELAG